MTGPCVYRLYAEDGLLLYIGSTKSLKPRLALHRHATIWRSWIARVESVGYPTIAEARAAEVAAIKTEYPRWNVIHRAADHPEGPARDLQTLVAKFPAGIERPHKAGSYTTLAYDALIAPVIEGHPIAYDHGNRERRWANARAIRDAGSAA